ncbi:MAG: hypothetical protein H7837_04875 [Magnetococcus sp. MYC-9]
MLRWYEPGGRGPLILFLYCIKCGIVASLVMVCAASVYIIPDLMRSVRAAIHERRPAMSVADDHESLRHHTGYHRPSHNKPKDR